MNCITWIGSANTGVYTYPPNSVIGEHKAEGSPLVISNGETVIVIDVTARKEQLIALLRRAADKLEREHANV